MKIRLDDLGEVALKSEKISEISSQCVVFAESEIISLKAKGEKAEDLAAGIHLATARRVFNLLNRVGIEPDIVFTGGVSKNTGMKVALENLLKTSFIDLSIDATYAGALGAAVYGTMFLKSGDVTAKSEKTATIADLSDLNEKIQKKQDTIISEKGTKKVGYLCTYTPLEILTASGVTAVRLAAGYS